MNNVLNRFEEIFFALVKIDAVSLKEKPVADFIRDFLRPFPVKIIEDHAGKIAGGNTGNLIIRIPAPTGGQPKLAFAAHMDTVKSTAGIQPMRKNGRFCSDGTTILGADNRVGIAHILCLIENIFQSALPFHSFEAVFTIGEETGLFGSLHLNTDLVLSRDIVILDSSADPGQFVYAAPGAVDFHIRCVGKGSHAAVNPEAGVNALHMATELVQGFPVGRVDNDTTINFGKVSGGEANNVVPPEVKISGEIRSFSNDKIRKYRATLENLCQKISRRYDSPVLATFEEAFPGFVLSRDIPVIKELSRKMGEVGLHPNPIRYYGGSDANILNNRGFRAIDLGIGAKNPHATNEYITLEDIDSISRLIHRLVMK